MREADDQEIIMVHYDTICGGFLGGLIHKYSRGDSDWDLSEGLDPEGPSASDLDQFGSEVDHCPKCGELIYDQAELCPHCGWYLGDEPKSVSLWVFAVAVVLTIVLLGIVF